MKAGSGVVRKITFKDVNWFKLAESRVGRRALRFLVMKLSSLIPIGS
jgi:hypothetical protein